MRTRLAFLLALLGIAMLFATECEAQTIPPGVGARHSRAKVVQNSSVVKQPAVRTVLNGMAPPNMNCDDLQNATKLQAWGPAKTIALRTVCSMDTHKYTAAQISDGLAFVHTLPDGASYADAIDAFRSADPTKPAQVIVKEAVGLEPHVDDVACEAVYDSDAKQFDYKPPLFLPATRTKCGDAGVQAFFNVTKTATFGNTVQYLYNPTGGTSQYSSDLLTATFSPGYQVILAGTITTNTNQTTSQSPQTGAQSTTTVDPVTSAAQKLEAGGDFNLRFSYPLASTPPGATAWSTYLQPALGFNLANTTSQTTSSGAQLAVSSSTQYFFYVPIESYFQSTSIAGTSTNGLTSATLFADIRYGGEFVSPDYQKTLGVPDRAFQLGEASAGINFAGSFRVGMQYFFGGPNQAYTLINPAGQTTPVNTRIKGFHVVFTFSPPKK